MTSQKVIAAVFFAAVFLLPASSRFARAAAPKTYVVALVQADAFSKMEFNQLYELMKVGASVYRQRLGVNLLIKPYKKRKELLGDIKNGRIDILMNYFPEAIKRNYEPFAQFSFFNEPVSRECVFVRKNSPYRNTSQLKSKSFVTSLKSHERYVDLARMIGANPMQFFNPLRGGYTEASMAYMLHMGQVDGAYMSVWPLGLASKSHPAPIKGIRKLECSPACPNSMLASPAMSPADRKSFLNFLINIKNEKAPKLKRYKALVDAVQLTFKPYSMQAELQCRAGKVKYSKATERFAPKAELDYSYWKKLVEDQLIKE